MLVYFNQSGNGFSREPLVVPLPISWSDIADLQFADLLGNGTACAVLATTGDDLSTRHLYYDFTGGTKPHLLTETDNNMGAVTRITYAPSTRFYLEDERAGLAHFRAMAGGKAVGALGCKEGRRLRKHEAGDRDRADRTATVIGSFCPGFSGSFVDGPWG